MRLLYVAATRARDLLVVPVVGSAPQKDGWAGSTGALSRARLARAARPAPPGCPVFGDDSVVVRPPKAPAEVARRRAGLHRPQAGDHQVVWWDPR